MPLRLHKTRTKRGEKENMIKKHSRICKTCGKKVDSTKTNSAKYCKKCYEQRVKELAKKYKQKYYQKNKERLRQKRQEAKNK